MFGLLGKKQQQMPLPPTAEDGAQVKVFLNPLIMVLAGRERYKGSPLTRDEVLAIRDTAQFVMMTPRQAQRFYADLDARVPVPRLDPDHVWEEWQEVRLQVSPAWSDEAAWGYASHH
jgi:hypothetical protein